MHLLKAFTPLDRIQLIEAKKSQATSSLMFLTKKCDGTIKARASAIGHKQRKYMSKDEIAALIIMLESIFITATLKAKQGRDVAVMDLHGAFLHRKNEDDVIVTMTGRLAELMVMIPPQIYQKYIIPKNKGAPMLYMKVQKAMGC